jgi:hypothetical protein
VIAANTSVTGAEILLARWSCSPSAPLQYGA